MLPEELGSGGREKKLSCSLCCTRLDNELQAGKRRNKEGGGRRGERQALRRRRPALPARKGQRASTSIRHQEL